MSGGGEGNSREGLELGLSLRIDEKARSFEPIRGGQFFNIVDECGSRSGSTEGIGGGSESLRKLQFLVGVKMLSRPSIGDGLNDVPSLALVEVGIALQTAAQETAASDAASIILLGNKLSQVHTVS